jgi:diguanylate cyclase (GGDEF)-like protein/PAS domain S-box-containing protein
MPPNAGSAADQQVKETVGQGIALSILAALPETSVLAFDRGLRFVLGTGPALGSHGFRPADLERERCADVLGQRWPLYEQAYRAALDGETTSLEVEAPGGERRYVVEVAPLRSDLGEVTGGVVIARDVTELRRLERGARLSERLLRVEFDESLIGMARIDLEGGFLEVNQAYVDLLGYSREQLAAMKLRDVTHPDELRLDLDAPSEPLSGSPDSYRSERRYLRADGRTVWTLTSVTLVSPDGHPAHLFAQVVDITDRERAEAQLALQATITERMGEGVVLVRARDSLIVYANRAFSTMLGYEPGELDGQPVAVVNVPTNLAAEDLAHEIIATLARDGVWGGRIENLKKDGSTCWCRASVIALEHPDHGLVWVAVHSDISQLKRSEDALREARERFEQAFEKAPIGMALVGLDGQFLRVNLALCDITGYAAEDLMAKSFQAITHPEDLDADLEYLRRLVAGEIRDYQMEKRYFKADGTIVWINLSVTLVRDADDQPLHFISQIQDVSDRKLLEARLRNLADHDSLTGLRNRRVFEEALLIQVGRCQRYGEQAALLMIDMDEFKAINDTYGHKTGDRTLKAVTAAISQRIRASDIAARLGGDEFAVLLAHVDAVQATIIAQDIQRAIEGATVLAGNRAIRPRASIGLALIDQDSAGDESVLTEADRAMYAAKTASVATGDRRGPVLTAPR